MKEDYHLSKNHLILLYLTLKVRKVDKPDKISKEVLKKEKENLEQLPLRTIVGYFESSIDTILAMKLNEIQQARHDPLRDDDVNAAREYETLLRKEEGLIRQNISLINQLKLSLENSVNESEELTRENSILKEKIRKAGNKNKGDLFPGLSLYEEFAVMKKKLQQYEEQYLQSLKQETCLKQQLLEKSKEIQRLEIISANSFNAIYGNAKDNKDSKRNSSLSQYQIKLAKDTSSNNIDSHYSKVTSQDIPILFNKIKQDEEERGKQAKLIEKGEHPLTRNKTNGNTQSCRSVSLLKERTSEDLSFFLKRNDQRTQRVKEATMKLYTNNDKRNSQSIKLIKVLQPKKKLMLPINLHKRTRSEIPMVNDNHKDISCCNIKSKANNTLSKHHKISN